MWNLPKGDQFLPSVSLRELQKTYTKEERAKPKIRLLAAIHRKKGNSIDDIAEALSVSRNTVYGWLQRFINRGINAQESIKQPGRPPVLSVKQREELVWELGRGPPNNPGGLWTTKQVKDFLKRKYGIVFVNQHVWRMLTQLGFSLQFPRKRHYKQPSEEELSRFKKKRDDKHDTTDGKALLWACKMRQRSVSFH